MNEKEYKKSLRQFHKHSDRHILVVETDMSFSDIQKVVALSDKIRKAGNELVGLMRKNYDQLIRTKRYRKVRKLYGATEEKKKRKVLARQLNEMQKQYHDVGVKTINKFNPIPYSTLKNSYFVVYRRGLGNI